MTDDRWEMRVECSNALDSLDQRMQHIEAQSERNYNSEKRIMRLIWLGIGISIALDIMRMVVQ